MRKTYVITDEQLESLLKASEPVRYMVVGGMVPSSPQENANRAWKALGEELGFHYMTVRPIDGASLNTFSAECMVTQ